MLGHHFKLIERLQGPMTGRRATVSNDRFTQVSALRKATARPTALGRKQPVTAGYFRPWNLTRSKTHAAGLEY